MTDRKKQDFIPPPSGARLPATLPPRPSLPAMPTGGGFAITETGRLRADEQYLTLYSAKLRALADNAVAMRELTEKRDALALALANLHSLPERCAHQYELGRLSRHNELELARLNAEHDQLQAKMRNAAAQLQLAQFLPTPLREQPPQPAPAPSGFSAEEVMAALDELTEHMQDVPPEARKHLTLLLAGYLKEKRK